MNNDVIKLNRFIVDNHELEILEADLKTFNPFKVLKLDTFEIRHSNILGWLLNPNDNHNLGDKFLKKVLGETIVRNENISIRKSTIDILTSNFSDVEVFREKNNIDILVVSEESKLVLAIENKIYSNEHDDQLNRYLAILKDCYQGFDIMPVFLTLTGVKSDSTDEWGTLSYEVIYKILSSILNLYSNTLNNKVSDFISYYLNILEELTMQDDKVIQLCQSIYKEHKEAIDLILKYGIGTSFSNAVKSLVEDDISIVDLGSTNSLFTFVPKEFTDVIPKNEGKSNGYPVEFYFFKSENKLKMILEVQPFRSVEKRVKFLTYLKDECNYKITDSSLAETSQYTRVFSKSVDIKDWNDREEILKGMKALYSNNEADEAKSKIINAVSKFNWHYE